MQPLTQAVLRLQNRRADSYESLLVLGTVLFIGVGSGVLAAGFTRQPDKATLISVGVALLVAGVAAVVTLAITGVGRGKALDSIRQEFHKFLAERGVALSGQAWRDLNLPNELPKTSAVMGTAEVLHLDKLTKVVLKYDASGPTDGTFVLLSAAGEPLRELTPGAASYL